MIGAVLVLALSMAAAGEEAAPPALPDLARFRERVQPVLAASCALAACHAGRGAGRLHLSAPDPSGRFSEGATRANYVACLRFVLPTRPAASPLVRKPLRPGDGGEPHGGGDVLEAGSPALEAIAAWIEGAPLPELPPLAHAGPDRTAAVGREVALEARGSRDPNGDPLTFQWRLEARPPASRAVLRPARGPETRLTPDVEGLYRVELIASDGALSSLPDPVAIVARGRVLLALEAGGGPGGGQGGGRAPDAGAGGRIRFELDEPGAYRVFVRGSGPPSGPAPAEIALDGGRPRRVLLPPRGTELPLEAGSGVWRIPAGAHEIAWTAARADASLERIFLVPAQAGGSGGSAAGRVERRLVREMYIDVLGRTPTPLELLAASERTPEGIAGSLLRGSEHQRFWYEETLFYLLLIDNFRPSTPRLASIPERLFEGSLTATDAIHELAASQFYHYRNLGPDNFVNVAFEQLLGRRPSAEELAAGKRMCEGNPTVFLGFPGASQSDFVRILVSRRSFHRHLLRRTYRRYFVGEPAEGDLEAWATRLAAAPGTFLDIQREWLTSPAYREQAGFLRRKDDRAFIRSLYVDLLGRLPRYEEERNMRNALLSLADTAPLKSVLARILLDSGRVQVPSKDSLDPQAWVRRQFLRLLFRPPSRGELEGFTSTLAGEGCSPRTVLWALLTSVEYQYY